MRRPSQILLAFLLLTFAPLHAQAPGGAWRAPGGERRLAPPRPLPWDTRAAAHLMRRAGFSAAPGELDDVVRRGFDATLRELLAPETVDDSAAEAALAGRAYRLARFDPENGRYYGDPINLQRAWMFRMLHSRRQLLEKMTLFWHDHFATSLEGAPFTTPEGLPVMQVQNDTLRSHALGNFREMLYAVARDPAMVLWLNNFENRVGAPNENWARELMELFTMGEGSGYTERDVQEAARAFTGWSLNRQFGFAFYWFFHDFEPKTILGRRVEYEVGGTGMEEGDRVIDILLEQPATADYVARKLWEFFVYPDPRPSLVSGLGRIFRDSGYDIRTLMEAIFRHPEFLSEKAYRAKVKGPVELAVGVCRELGVGDPGNLPVFLFFFGLGQSLYLPPDVGGWPSDARWINTGTILGRYNFMTLLSSKRLDLDFGLPGGDVVDIERIAAENELYLPAEFVNYFVRAMVQDDLSLDARYALEDYMNAGDALHPGPFDAYDLTLLDKKVRGLIHLVSTLPVYQLN